MNTFSLLTAFVLKAQIHFLVDTVTIENHRSNTNVSVYKQAAQELQQHSYIQVILNSIKLISLNIISQQKEKR